MDSSKPFGGKIFVFEGDFCQVLLLLPKVTKEQTVAAKLSRSYLWNKMHKIQLQINMRAKTDSHFADFLLRVGNGDEVHTKDDFIQLPNEILIQNVGNDGILELINNIYSDRQN